jgi:calcium-dependent protein kinase
MFKTNIADNIKILHQELSLLRSLDHPNIIRFYETYEDERYIHFVMEYCSGGELFEKILKKG